MKKLISLALAFIMCILPLLLFSCSNKPEPNPVTDFEYGYREEYGGMSITKYIGTSKRIVFHEEIDGQPVKIIGGYLLDEGEMRPLIESVVIPDTVEVIALSTFSGCKNLLSVDFGKGVREIQDFAFAECTALKKILLPPKLEKIGAGAFYGCSSATELFIPKTLAVWAPSVSRGTFASCTALKTVTFEDGLEQIGYWGTFMGADALERIEIPASVKKIAPLAFNGCPSLTTVIFEGDVPQATEGTVKNAFGYEGDHDNLVIYYSPDASGWDTVVWRELHQLKPLS